MKRVRPPKPIEAPKPERPRRSILKSIYKDLISSDSEQRVETLRRAIGWYDQCVVYVGYPIDHEWPKPQLKLKLAAERVRTAGISSVNNNTKEESFTTAIKSYEKLVNGFKPPLINNYLKRLRHDQIKLDVRKKKLTKRYGEFLDLLKQMLNPKNVNGHGISLRVDRISTEYRIDTYGNIIFNHKFVSYLSKLSRKQGMLTAVVEIFPMLMEAAGRMEEKDDAGRKTGRVLVSNAKCRASVKPMLTKLNQYYLSGNPLRKLVRRPRVKRRVQ